MKGYLVARKGATYYSCVLKWYVDGKRKSKELSTGIPIKGNNKRRAEQKVEELKSEYEQKYEIYNLANADVLFSDYMLEWLDGYRYNIRQSTYQGYKQAIEKRIVPYFRQSGVKLCDLQPQHIQRYYTYLLDNGLSASSVKHHHANIRKALQDALLQNRIMYNPADRVRLPKVEKYHAKIFTKEQLEVLFDKIKGHPIEAAVILAAYYGLRRGEVCGLEWHNIDFEQKVIHIVKTRTTKAHEITEEKTKTESSRRNLPLLPSVEKFLIELRDKQAANRVFMDKGYYESDFVCVWDDGKPLGCEYISRHFSRMAKEVGCEGATFHSLRHTAGTMISNSGMVSLKTVQEFLGHSDITTTQIYLHPDFEQYRKAANVMESQLGDNK